RSDRGRACRRWLLRTGRLSRYARRERPARMPEQLALELALRDVRAIHRQVDLVRPRPGRLDVSRDHVLAYPRLAENQDRRGRCRGLARARQEVLHERAFADWRREPVAAADFPAERPHFPPQSPQLESATHPG